MRCGAGWLSASYPEPGFNDVPAFPPSALRLPHIERVLASQGPGRHTRFFERAAAVAMVLRFSRDAPDLLLMRRIERRGDPWSGHVSLPGGGSKRGEHAAVDIARRETQEEVGLDLGSCARVLGVLPPLHPVPRGLARPLHITPVVFEQTQWEEPRAGEEAAHTFWLPLDQVASGALDGTLDYRIAWSTRRFPCWRHDGETVWGLTHHVVSVFLNKLREAA
ncbi:MAG: CoA pyrophosphatase [Pseudomonadota bacterium]